MNKEQINYWKIATIILGLIAILLMIYQVVNESRMKEEIVNINGINVPLSFLENLYNVTERGVPIKICDIEENKCAMISFKQ